MRLQIEPGDRSVGAVSAFEKPQHVLTACRACGHQVSKNASKCPQCADPDPTGKTRRGALGLLWFFLGVPTALIAAVVMFGETTSTPAVTAAASVLPASDPGRLGYTFKRASWTCRNAAEILEVEARQWDDQWPQDLRARSRDADCLPVTSGLQDFTVSEIVGDYAKLCTLIEAPARTFTQCTYVLTRDMIKAR